MFSLFFLYHILNICMYNNMYNIYLSIYINLFYCYSYSKREYILSVYGAMFLSSGSIDRKKQKEEDFCGRITLMRTWKMGDIFNILSLCCTYVTVKFLNYQECKFMSNFLNSSVLCLLYLYTWDFFLKISPVLMKSTL